MTAKEYRYIYHHDGDQDHGMVCSWYRWKYPTGIVDRVGFSLEDGDHCMEALGCPDPANVRVNGTRTHTMTPRIATPQVAHECR